MGACGSMVAFGHGAFGAAASPLCLVAVGNYMALPPLHVGQAYLPRCITPSEVGGSSFLLIVSVVWYHVRVRVRSQNGPGPTE